MKISILMPTRGRPKLLRRMWKQCLSLANHPEDVEYIIYIDDDDTETIRMYNKMKNHVKYGNQIKAIIGEKQEMLGQYHNECCKISDADIVCVMGDDCEFLTQGWDDMVLDVFAKSEDKILLVYGDSGHRARKMAVIWFVHKNWVKALGYVNPPYFKCAEGDRWTTYLAKEIKRLCYLPEMKIYHRFRLTDGDVTSQIRSRYRKKMLRIYDRDDMKKIRQADAEKLKEYMKEQKK